MANTKLSGYILQRHDFSDEVEKALETAAADNPVNTRRHHAAIAIAGIGMGIDAAQQYVLRQMATNVATVRAAVKQLEKLVLLPLDMESLTTILETKKVFDDALSEQAKQSSGAFVDEVVRQFNIGGDLIVGGKSPSEMPRLDIEAAGHKAYQSQPAAFAGWALATKRDLLSEMNCRCQVCLSTLSTLNRYAPSVAFDDVLQMTNSLGEMFYQYGAFVITMLQEELAKTLEGVEGTHEHQGSATTMMNDLFSSLGVRPDDPESAESA